MPLKDREARRAYHRQYMREYLQDPERKQKHLDRVRVNDRRYDAERQEVIDEFRAGGCRLCDEKAECCLSAHHLDPAAKEFSIGDAKRMRVSVDRLKDELMKCVCVCENCHRKVHAGLLKT